MENTRRFNIDYNEDQDCIAMFDNIEQSVFIMNKVHVEELVKWYCMQFGRILS